MLPMYQLTQTTDASETDRVQGRHQEHFYRNFWTQACNSVLQEVLDTDDDMSVTLTNGAFLTYINRRCSTEGVGFTFEAIAK